MIFKILYISAFFVIVLLISFILNKNYTLNLLILLEGMMLMSILFCISMLMQIEDKTVMLILLTFAACEAAMGLSILIAFLRIRSNAIMNVISLNTWFLLSLKK